MSRLAKYLRTKKNPELAVLDFLEGSEKLADKLIKENVDKSTKQIVEKLNKNLAILLKELADSIPETALKVVNQGIQQFIERNESRFKGNKGIDGMDGIDGINGRDGVDGKNGIDGKDGKDGKDGSPDKPEEIATKINTLNEKIEPKTIKGLETTLEKIKRAVRLVASRKESGGGGMGNVQHQVFNITSATTSVETTYPIAGAGTAIFCFTYENARLEMTNHYTVGSDRKTITFNADVQAQLENGTTAAITYIRG